MYVVDLFPHLDAFANLFFIFGGIKSIQSQRNNIQKMQKKKKYVKHNANLAPMYMEPTEHLSSFGAQSLYTGNSRGQCWPREH